MLPQTAATASTTHSPFALGKVDLAALTDDEHAEYLAFQNQLLAESKPDDPPRTLEAYLARRRTIPSYLEIHQWEVRDTALPAQPIVGIGELTIARQEANPHLASLHITVLPERRREGIARLLLRPLATTAHEQARTTLMMDSNSRVPAGEAFLRHLGAEPGLHSHTNQLALSELDRDTLRAYREQGERRSGDDFEFLYCQSPIPDELLASTVELGNRVARDIPRGDLAMENQQFTVDEIREMDRKGMASGFTMMAVIAKEQSGTFAGLTTMTWSSHAPYLAEQGVTGVLPEYRGRGLARTMKAIMLERLLDTHPEARFVRTDNADSNAAMLAVNNTLGFRPYRSETHWQVPTERVLAYLAG